LIQPRDVFYGQTLPITSLVFGELVADSLFSQMVPFLVILAGTPLLFRLGLALKHRTLMPVLCALPGYAGYVLGLTESVVLSFCAVLFWSVLQTALVLSASLKQPEELRNLVLNGESYSQSMFDWIETGDLPEGSPLRVLFYHLRQAVVYCLIALLTGNFGSIVLGCILLNYMNYYVAFLISRSSSPVRALLTGWNFWSIIRVLSFVWIGCILGIPLLSLVIGTPPLRPILFIPGAVGVGLDILLKIIFSEPWRILIKRGLKTPFGGSEIRRKT
jgi:hypothetical protein